MVAAEANPQGRAAGSGTLVSNILAHLALNITKKNSTFKVSNCGGSRCETDFDCQSSHGGGCKCKRNIGRKMGRCRPVAHGVDPQFILG